MKKLLTLSLAVSLGLGLSNAANALVIDGKLDDWGLSNQWTPTSNNNGSGQYLYSGLTIYYTVEDYTSGNGFIGPGWGGQAYDAEALYVTWDAANLYIALVTGHDPNTADNAPDSFGPGDFALAFWSDAKAINYTYGIETTGNSGLKKGDIYQISNWSKSPYWGGQHITSIAAGTQIGTANLMISTTPVTGVGAGPSGDKHWIYEVSAPRSIFNNFLKQGNEKLNVSWTMNCANDIIVVKDDPPVRVDEPPVLALLGLTLPVMFWRRRRSIR